MRVRVLARIARHRVRATKAFQRVALGPIASNIPGDAWARSVVERLHEPKIARHVVETWTRSPATVEHYDFPTDFPPYFRRTKAFDERHAYRLRNVILSPHSGLVWLPNGPVLAESFGSLIRLLGWQDVRSEILLPVRSHVGSVIPFPNMPYYHWLLEVVPAALFSLSVRPESSLLLPLDAPNFANEIAKKIAPGRVSYAAGICQADECIVAARDALPGFIKRAEIQRLRESLPRSGRDYWAKRIYVSRRRDATRSLANERDVEDAMREEGLVIVYTQDLSVEDQMSLFSSVELVVAPHGAGLANLVWADGLPSVVEIFPTNYFNDCYARLSQTVGGKYRYVMCDADTASAGIVPIGDLVEAVRRMS